MPLAEQLEAVANFQVQERTTSQQSPIYFTCLPVPSTAIASSCELVD